MEIIRVQQQHLDSAAILFDAYRQYYGQKTDLVAAKNFLSERLLLDESVIFLALEGNKPLGFTQLYPMFSSISMERQWVLNDLFVNQNARNLGIGKQILEKAQDFIKQIGHKGLLLETTPDNEKAQKLYEKLGWKREENYYFYWKA
jgi:GNAT superfamily N-acetyltransferase